MTTVSGVKRCHKCGKDVTHDRRMKDGKGQYWCADCGGSAEASTHGSGLIAPCPKCGTPTHAAQLARERQFARELVRPQSRLGQLATGRENAERNRQVETTGCLRQVSGRQIDRDAPRRKFEPAVLQCRAYPLPAFLDFGVGQTHQRQAREPVRKMDFDRHRARCHARNRPAAHDGQCHAFPLRTLRSIA